MSAAPSASAAPPTDTGAGATIAAEPRPRGSGAVAATVMDGQDLHVHVIPSPVRVLVLNAQIWKVYLLVEVRQVAFMCPVSNLSRIAIGMAIVVVAVTVVFVEPLLIVPLELVIEDDAIDARASL